jgi:hypothetical protein
MQRFASWVPGVSPGYGLLLLRLTATTASFDGGAGKLLWPFADLSWLLHSVEIITSGLFVAGLATAYAGAVQAAIEILWAFDGRDAAWGHLVKCALAMTLAMLGPTASAFLAGGLGVPSFSVQ